MNAVDTNVFDYYLDDDETVKQAKAVALFWRGFDAKQLAKKPLFLKTPSQLRFWYHT
jgi:hypothetical protein